MKRTKQNQQFSESSQNAVILEISNFIRFFMANRQALLVQTVSLQIFIKTRIFFKLMVLQHQLILWLTYFGLLFPVVSLFLCLAKLSRSCPIHEKGLFKCEELEIARGQGDPSAGVIFYDEVCHANSQEWTLTGTTCLIHPDLNSPSLP